MPDSLVLRVIERKIEAEDVVSFRLADPEGRELPEWAPGAHVDVEIRPGLIRQYSLCGEVGDRTWRIAVLREDPGRGGSRHLHDHVHAGAELRVGRPRNNFPLADAERYVFVAGGIGITPLLPMIAAVRHAEWTLYYGGRRRSRMAFLGELAGYGNRVRILPEDEYGLLPLTGILADSGAVAHCCGPEPLLAAAERACAGPLRVERFHPKSSEALPGNGFEVLAATTGRTVRVAPGESILDALSMAGVMVPSSCREGTCASCETTVLDGEVEHRDSVLSEEERASGKTMMICVSRARSERLTLDL